MATFSLDDIYIILPEVLMALAVLMGLLFGAIKGNQSTPKILAGITFTSIAVLVLYIFSPSESLVAFGGLVVSDTFSKYLKIISASVLVLMTMVAYPAILKSEMERFEFPLIMLTILLGSCLLFISNDLISIFMALELMSLSTYVLVGMRRNNLKTHEAALKYVVLGALSTAILLFGFSLLYCLVGSTHFDSIHNMLRTPELYSMPFALLAIAVILSGVAFKVSVAPFHMWTPDVYEGTPTIVTSMISTLPKIAGVALLLKLVLGPLSPLVEHWQAVLVILALISIAVGTFSALKQVNLHRFIAFSSTAQMGYLLLGTAAASDLGVRSVLTQLTIYVFTTLGLFSSMLLLRSHGVPCKVISDLAGLHKTNPLIAASIAIFMLSFAGVPPVVGFLGKLYVILAAVESGLVYPALFAAIASIVSCYYYLRVIKTMYFDDGLSKRKETTVINFQNHVPTLFAVGVCVLFVLIASFYPAAIFDPTASAARAMSFSFVKLS